MEEAARLDRERQAAVRRALESDETTPARLVVADSATAIAQWAYKGQTDIEEVVLPEGLVSIGERAF
jgi:hypothetical protein